VVNLDAFSGSGVNVVQDLAKMPLPFRDNSFDFIIANHVMEHIPKWWDCFQELARVVKPGGTIEIWVPPVSSDSAFTYRDHINYIGPESFYGIGDLNRPGTNLTASVELKDFTHVQRLHIKQLSHRLILTWWTMLAPESLANWMAEHLRNVVSEDGYFFTKV
jgi:ubiquinone/menaquinone biosynthesis C-methylase UbiE